ncbi:hypothetical protein H7J86_24615 [Mycobacterium hackensackense]|uniref:hypothetical protein n=1 Tax=Mycobacterium hackensackense TaxID=228909 RepID=UPI002265C389|nr:hypothetical protein [Mycobacterium hackensackense]MCV7255351.1 hypothetical protein [Mycobacterium hackensackense]
MAWPIVQWNGVPHYQAQGDFLIPVDPSTGAAVIMLREDGGVGDGFSAIEKGDPGSPAELVNPVVWNEKAWDDPSPLTASFITVRPPTATESGQYQLVADTRAGKPGDDGNTILDPADFGGGTPGQTLVINTDGDGFELTAVKIPEAFFPGSVRNTPSGNVSYTIGQIAIPARPYARRVIAHGGTVVTGEGADVRVDLIARLNGETGGNIIGRCPGIAQTERLTLWSGKAAGLADDYDQLPANAEGTVWIRLERQAGTTTFTSTASTTRVWAEVLPL